MLIEFWERLRGYDKWIQTEAVVKSSNLAEVRVGDTYLPDSGREPVYEWQSDNTIAWTDSAGHPHESEYQVSEDSPLFQLYDGQKVIIRYNPAKPEEFYLRGVLESRVKSAAKWGLAPVLLAILYMVILGLRVWAGTLDR